jgi:hypothetical protein
MAILAYQLVRALKWLIWLGFVGYSLYFIQDRSPHLNQFGHLTISTEMMMFGLPLAAIVVGMLQLCLWDLAYPKAGQAPQRAGGP